MLFHDNLAEIVFHRNELFRCDELIIISGYVGPDPIARLGQLPLRSTVVYGMYGCDGIQKNLHEALLKSCRNLTNVKLLYSSFPVHAKCYIWKHNGKVVHALIGSANFSSNGLDTPNKEVLAETTADTFDPLADYSQMVIDQAIDSNNATVKSRRTRPQEGECGPFNPDVCSVPLYIVRHGVKVVPNSSGINWGQAGKNGSHVNPNDAYLPIRVSDIERYPDLFPRKQEHPVDDSNVARKNHRHNDSIEIIWDDGTTMTGLLEGTVKRSENGVEVVYPKQVATTPAKSLLGQYLRKRLSVPSGAPVSMADLLRYGRSSIDISLQGEGIYYFDFSKPQQDQSAASTTSSGEIAAQQSLMELLPSEEHSDGLGED